MNDVNRLILKGQALTRNEKPKFRNGTLEFGDPAYDQTGHVQLFSDEVNIPISETTGAFRVTVLTGGSEWVGKMTLVDYDGKVYVDRRILPATGDVDYFTAAKAVDLDSVTWPKNEVPLLVSSFNKPGGPLQLTDEGTIGDAQIPGDFLRLNDDRIPALRNYVTVDDYLDGLAKTRRTVVVDFFGGDETWEYDYSQAGIDYRPLVMTMQSDNTEVMGAVSYPVGTTKVVVQFSAPTSGTMILR